MPSIGPLELVVILVIALIVFGPKRLPELGRSLGRGIREFRSSVSNIGGDDEDEGGAGESDRRKQLSGERQGEQGSKEETVDGEIVGGRHE